MTNLAFDPPLAGIRILALENYLAGNIGSMAFVRFGAEVIKIEMPGVGDIMRNTGPSASKDGRTRNLSELRVMGGKQSVALDLSKEKGRSVLWRLVQKSDVVWTNMKPSSLENYGITFETLKQSNAQIIYTTLSGFGHSDLMAQGPMGHLTAFDLVAQGMAGLQFRVQAEGDRPGYNGLPLGDQVSAMNAVLGTVLALYRRTRSAAAQRVDVAMHDSMVSLNELPIGLTAFTGQAPPRGRSGTSAPYGAYKTKDGYVNIAIGSSPIWRRLCEAMERPDLLADTRFESAPGRVEHYQFLDEEVEAWTRSRSAAEIIEHLSRRTIPCAPIYDLPDVVRSPQVAARNMLVTVKDPVAGDRQIVGNPIKMSANDDLLAPIPHDCGEDGVSVLQMVAGLSLEEIERLRGDGILGGRNSV